MAIKQIILVCYLVPLQRIDRGWGEAYLFSSIKAGEEISQHVYLSYVVAIISQFFPSFHLKGYNIYLNQQKQILKYRRKEEDFLSLCTKPDIFTCSLQKNLRIYIVLPCSFKPRTLFYFLHSFFITKKY